MVLAGTLGGLAVSGEVGGGAVEAGDNALLDFEPPSVPVDVEIGWLR